MRSYRAICSSCMKENGDAAAYRCPSCGSNRLVVVAGRAQVGRTPKKVAPPAAPHLRLALEEKR